MKRWAVVLPLVFLGLVAAVVFAACGGDKAPAAPSNSAVNDHFFNSFKKAVASASEDGYTPYWLGREFQASGLTFLGPYVSDLPDVSPPGGVSMDYLATTGYGHLEITVYSAAAWEKDRIRQEGSVTRLVPVAGQDARLHVTTGGTRPIEVLQLLLTFGDTTVRAVVHAGGAAAPGGPDYEPLIDEKTFITVMQQIRPYPQ